LKFGKKGKFAQKSWLDESGFLTIFYGYCYFKIDCGLFFCSSCHQFTNILRKFYFMGYICNVHENVLVNAIKKAESVYRIGTPNTHHAKFHQFLAIFRRKILAWWAMHTPCNNAIAAIIVTYADGRADNAGEISLSVNRLRVKLRPMASREGKW